MTEQNEVITKYERALTGIANRQKEVITKLQKALTRIANSTPDADINDLQMIACEALYEAENSNVKSPCDHTRIHSKRIMAGVTFRYCDDCGISFGI